MALVSHFHEVVHMYQMVHIIGTPLELCKRRHAVCIGGQRTASELRLPQLLIELFPPNLYLPLFDNSSRTYPNSISRMFAFRQLSKEWRESHSETQSAASKERPLFETTIERLR